MQEIPPHMSGESTDEMERKWDIRMLFPIGKKLAKSSCCQIA